MLISSDEIILGLYDSYSESWNGSFSVCIGSRGNEQSEGQSRKGIMSATVWTVPVSWVVLCCHRHFFLFLSVPLPPASTSLPLPISPIPAEKDKAWMEQLSPACTNSVINFCYSGERYVMLKGWPTVILFSRWKKQAQHFTKDLGRWNSERKTLALPDHFCSFCGEQWYYLVLGQPWHSGVWAVGTVSSGGLGVPCLLGWGDRGARVIREWWVSLYPGEPVF